MDKTKLVLTMEPYNGKIWGRVMVDDNLVMTAADTIEDLETKLRQILEEFHDLKEVEFERNLGKAD